MKRRNDFLRNVGKDSQRFPKEFYMLFESLEEWFSCLEIGDSSEAEDESQKKV